MKDLKHLYYFENLLGDANNDLIKQAQNEGKLAIGYTCFHMPELLLNLDKCFSLRMRAPKTGSLDIATYYMSNYTCEFCRAIVERAFEGGYNFIDAIAGVDACAVMNRAMENIEVNNLIEKKGFFISHIDVPYKVNADSVAHYVEQIKLKVLNKLQENFGVDISEASMRKAVELHNEVCRLITAIGEFRKEENPRITGYEFHILTIISYVCPKYLIVEKLRETLEELKSRQPDSEKKFRAKVVLVGSEIDDPDLTKLIEDAGALIVADRFCFGSFPGRQEIVLKDNEPVLESICRQYLEQSQCPRYVSHEKINQRHDFAESLYRDFHADGIIYEQIQFCDYWCYERALASHIMTEERGIPTLSIDRPYMSRTSGQLRTRVQAFVESLEIKKIQKDKRKEA
jgi:benzoyl-CoA reductase/2-hydroxyglutaryl-CoA dehydratase subunit BcrC/BadD/HgdB